MKKSLLLYASGLFFFMALTAYVNAPISSYFILTTVGEEPILPDAPFAYSAVEFPNHLLMTDTIDTGYESGGVDTTVFDFIEDDIATLGRVLFYDKKLSSQENISCASCHDQSLSFTETKAVSEGVSAPTKRNSMHLNDMAWTNNTEFFWDMSQDDLHTMIRLPLMDENEIGADINEVKMKLGATSYYPDLFSNAYGDSFISEDRVVDALVQFIRSMNTFNSRFDQEADKGFEGFNDKELFGLELFATHCTSCHSQGGKTFFGEEVPIDIPILDFMPFIFNNGLPEDPDDRGAGEWSEHLNNLFKIPTLRNIELTGPYMHDGRFDSLEEVVDHYSDGIEGNEWTGELLPPEGFHFLQEEKDALVSFLKTLTDETFLTNPKWSDPFDASPTSTKVIPFDNLVLKPNPMRNLAQIEFDNQSQELVAINIFSADGRLIKRDNTRSNQYILNRNDFENGMYLIEMIMGDRKSTQKLMVQ